MDVIEQVALSAGLKVSMVRALLALLASVPISHAIFFLPSPSLKHLYSFLSGCVVCWLAFGTESLLHLLAISVLVFACVSLLPRRTSGNITAVLCFLTLIALHIRNYDRSKWREGEMDYTGTLMILVLKLVSLALDYQDGGIPPHKAHHKKYRNRLVHRPSFLSFLSFVFFPASVLYGPVFDYNDFTDFIQQGKKYHTRVPKDSSIHPTENGPTTDDATHSLIHTPAAAATAAAETADDDSMKEANAGYTPTPSPSLHLSTGNSNSSSSSRMPGSTPMPYPLSPSLLSFLYAFAWLLAAFAARDHFPTQFLKDPRYFRMSLAGRILFMVANSLASRAQFYFVWGVADSAMIASGFAFNGWKEGEEGGGKGVPDWSHLHHCSPYMIEIGTTSTAQVVNHWNSSVARWMRTYVYDRVTPANGKPTAVTLVITQVVSAFWHGWQPGYYLCFVNGALCQHATKMVYRYAKANSWPEGPHDFVQRVFKQLFVAYCVAGFQVLTLDDTFALWRSQYFFGTLLPAVTILLLSLLKQTRVPRQKTE